MPQEINNRSSSYFIARALQRCESCRTLTPVVGLVLPASHETLVIDADEASDTLAAGVWEAAAGGAILFDVEYLSDAVQGRLRQLSQHYRNALSEMSGRPNWLNHCSFCGAQQADFDLYCEPEGAFVPISAEAAARLRLYEVREPFEAQAAGYAYAPEFFECAEQEICS